ncbi:MAG: hypothetical protein GWN67_22780 [Phycisphaerae bacterium]|nr:hypothetical protein [Phycisphaerae bacterium]NIR67894.1 hypothetical protein [candidate division Zixibacteria bacterium]NIP54990.1 hypothetical protein [Phycisphaerae bacterium]NIS53705.1 hypothetical protein [Phycisphaerae bacterium]NIU11276.1 hypothetical protein [Phycisphaerae bacterium]
MKRRTYLKTCGILVFLLSTTFSSSAARTIYVDNDGPADFNNIQAAIDDANDGDTIIVADGTYTGGGNRDIDFLGKAITLRSENGPDNCIIDCQGSEADRHRGFYFHSGEDANSVVDGFTITKGYGPVNFVGEPISSAGGAILCVASRPTISNCIINCNSASNGGGICCGTDSSPLIKNCTIVNNDAGGGGIYCVDSCPHITNCLITNNIAPWFPGPVPTSGGGIKSEVSSPIIENCIISGNAATGEGGGILCAKGNPSINNCTISYNSASGDGGGIMCYADCVLIVSNCIFWGNIGVPGPQISLVEIELLGGCPTFTISYSDVQGGAAGVYIDSGCTLNWEAGNIDIDPLFADSGDYHLKSQAGRWETSSQAWVQDDVTSPCIDGGKPEDPIGNEPFPNGGVINMGAYGGTAEASKSYFGRPVCEIIVAGDVNGDCIVNYLDFRLMALNWLRDESK